MFSYWENPIGASVNSDLKLHISGIPFQNTSFFALYNRNQLCAIVNSDFKLHKSDNPSLKFKILFVKVSTLALNCTNAIIHCKIRIFECFAIEKPICASVNSDLKLHKLGNQVLNTCFCAFYNVISALCKYQL